MVSTRGVKLKFYEGERVLCYEPDPTKAKVLYDSKVLDIVTNKDHRGRKSVEYLIHFQGWNSSWDRCVGEEYVLKDTPENRQLQKDLAEKSQLQCGTYLYKKERKKLNRKSDGPNSEDDGNMSSPPRMDTDDSQDQDVVTSSDDDSSIEDESIPVELTPELREVLDHDHFLINTKHKLHNLPADPNIVTILENYWKHYMNNQLCYLNEKNNASYRLSFNQSKPSPEDVQRNLTICKEVLDGLRVYFDFTLSDLLLYKSEQIQIQTVPSMENIKTEMLKFNNDYFDSHHPNNNSSEEDYNHSDHHDQPDRKKPTRRRNLRSSLHTESQVNGNHSEAASINNKPCISVSSGNSDSMNPMLKLLTWRALPEYVYSQQPPSPCLVYGATHLLRLFIKLPELLSASTVSDDKIKLLLRHFDSLIYYLSEHKEWFGERHYIDTQ